MLKIIIDFDGTLTVEEKQARPLAEKSLDTLADEILNVSRQQLSVDYDATQARLLAAPHQYWWEVNGLVASYCDEGAFILNTTTLQVMLRENRTYAQAVANHFPDAEYDPVVDCTNYLFHRHTAELPPVFRPGARELLISLCRHPAQIPVVLTNSLGNKVRRFLGLLVLDDEVDVLGDTRQYDMAPTWVQCFSHPDLGQIQVWPLADRRHVDLRRPIYYRALLNAASDGSRLAVVADTFSLPGALPLLMGWPFFLLRTPYTPPWCSQVVEEHPRGYVLESLVDLPDRLAALEI